MSDKKLVALEIRDARQAGYAAVSERIAGSSRCGGKIPVWEVWAAIYAYQAATERALLGDDAEEPGPYSRSQQGA